MAKLTIDFFGVEVEPETLLFETIIRTVSAQAGKTRNLEYQGDVIRLQTADVSNQTCEGDITRIRMRDLPLKAKADGRISDIELDDDEGLGEQSAFAYHAATKTLAIQRNRYSVTPSNFAHYFGERMGGNTIITLHPVLRLDAIRRLADMETVTMFDVAFARVTNPQLFAGQGRSANEFVDLMRYFKTPYARIHMTAGRKLGASLPVRLVRAAARLLAERGVQHDNDKVTKIEIKGTKSDGTAELLDLIKDRMIEEIDVQNEGRHSRYPIRRKAVADALERRENELRQLRGTPG